MIIFYINEHLLIQSNAVSGSYNNSVILVVLLQLEHILFLNFLNVYITKPRGLSVSHFLRMFCYLLIFQIGCLFLGNS